MEMGEPSFHNHSPYWDQDYLLLQQQQQQPEIFPVGSLHDQSTLMDANVADVGSLFTSAEINGISPTITACSGAISGKPKRRRSKGTAASQASTTFLKASITNFRALVQQHTGCNHTASPKGPITLCFTTPAPSTTDHWAAAASLIEQPHHSNHLHHYYH